MRIAILVEGKTEIAFMPKLREFLEHHLAGQMPMLDPVPYNGPIPKEAKLRRVVKHLLHAGKQSADAVIALTDVYTGRSDFVDAADAKRKMKQWVGDFPSFYPHAAQYDFEAWLLPYWPTIQQLAKHNKAAPSGDPERANHDNPPARRIEEIFRIGACREKYIKPRDAKRILKDNDLMVAVNACPELKSFLNTILTICGASSLP